MEFKFAEEFADDLIAKVNKPGVRVFLAEALREFESELMTKSARFLSELPMGKLMEIGLERKGKVQILRRNGNDHAIPSFLFRFLGAPPYVIVAVADTGCEFENNAPIQRMALTSIIEIAEELAKNTSRYANVAISRRGM